MEEEKKEDLDQGPSTSKAVKEGKNDEELEDRDREREHDDRSRSETTSYYTDSRGDPRDGRKLTISKGDRRQPERRRRVHRGRVMKPRRSTLRRRPVLKRSAKEKPTRRPMRHVRQDSISTFVSNHSSIDDGSYNCKYCGHRCCGRRLTKMRRAKEMEKKERRKYLRRITRGLQKMRKQKTKMDRKIKRRLHVVINDKPRRKSVKDMLSDKTVKTGSEAVQSGSNKMLSPLMIGTNATLDDKPPQDGDQSNYSEITPEMMCERLHDLTKWRQAVTFSALLDAIQANYPVNPNKEELSQELESKLAVAVMIRMIMEQVKNNVKFYSVSTKLHKRGPTSNQVSVFWKVYCDTMRPIQKRQTTAADPELLLHEGWRRRSQCTCNPPPRCFCQCSCQPMPEPPYTHLNTFSKDGSKMSSNVSSITICNHKNAFDRLKRISGKGFPKEKKSQMIRKPQRKVKFLDERKSSQAVRRSQLNISFAIKSKSVQGILKSVKSDLKSFQNVQSSSRKSKLGPQTSYSHRSITQIYGPKFLYSYPESKEGIDESQFKNIVLKTEERNSKKKDKFRNFIHNKCPSYKEFVTQTSTTGFQEPVHQSAKDPIEISPIRLVDRMTQNSTVQINLSELLRKSLLGIRTKNHETNQSTYLEGIHVSNWDVVVQAPFEDSDQTQNTNSKYCNPTKLNQEDSPTKDQEKLVRTLERNPEIGKRLEKDVFHHTENTNCNNNNRTKLDQEENLITNNLEKPIKILERSQGIEKRLEHVFQQQNVDLSSNSDSCQMDTQEAPTYIINNKSQDVNCENRQQ